MKAIETIYNGYRFRSKLEAKWAVFFDQLGIRYEYEPEAFKVDNGWYTPDFFLPNVCLRYADTIGVCLEIKPTAWEYDRPYVDRISKAANGMPLLLLPGDPLEFVDYGYGTEGGYQVSPGWDNCMIMVWCPDCCSLKFEFSEGNYMYCPHCNSPRCVSTLSEAASIARQHRFAHSIPA